jgi:two-component system NtrC family sensor kinase
LANYLLALLTRQKKTHAAEETADLEYLLEDIPNLIKESIDGANRITKIVNGLKLFSRIDSDEKEALYVNGCIKIRSS